MATFCKQVFDTDSPAKISSDINILDEPVVSSPIGESAPKIPSQPPTPLTNVPSATLPIPSEREKEKLERTLGGIRDMSKVPSAIWIVDTKKEHIAVGEARKLNIPVVAILDTNCDPDEVDYKIPGNDDAIRSAALLTRVIADAVAEGLRDRAAQAANAGRGDKTEATDGQLAADEPLAEWERDLLAPTGGGDAAAADSPAPSA